MMLKEILATIGVILSMLAVPALVLFQQQHLLASEADGAQIFTLSGVAENGVWTLATVNAGNYWWKTFEPAQLQVEQGSEVVLRLQGSDVHHRFYAPGLNIGPVDVEPGHTELVRFRADAAGTFEYYCTAICGDCHFHMSGSIVVYPKGQKPQERNNQPLADDTCPQKLAVPSPEDMIAWGRYLYQKRACVTCHGKEGQGGVVNFNYLNDTIAAHNTLAEKFFLEEEEEAEAFIELLLKKVDLDKLENPPGIPRFLLVLTQYKAAKDLIVKGKACAKRDLLGPLPPLQMPSWRETLSDHDIDSIIAYLLRQYPWPEFEEDEQYDP